MDTYVDYLCEEQTAVLRMCLPIYFADFCTAVLDDWQGRGVGSGLVRALLDDAALTRRG